MSFKRNFVAVIIALILVCALPVSSSALGNLSPYDERIAYYTYNNYNISASSSPWFHIAGSYNSNGTVNYERVGHIHCRGGSVEKAFVIFIPLVGYYLVVVQSNDLHSDFDIDSSTHATLTNSIFYRNGTETVQQTYMEWHGDGYLTSQNLNLFQTVLFGHYVIFYNVGYVGSTDLHISRYSSDKYSAPTSSEQDSISSFVGNNSGTGDVFPGGSAAVEFLDGQKEESETYPDGTPVPTNADGNPAPTNQWGETVPTLENGKPVPTYPNGKPVQTWEDSSGLKHTVPYDEINGEAYPTVHNPDGTVDIVTTTVINNGEVESDARENFSKLRMWVTSLDLFETLASSVYDDVSDKVDNTRGLIDNVFGWFPVWLPAVIMLGMVVILAIKIIGR